MEKDILICFTEFLFSYILLCILFPSFILHPFLKDKELSYRLMFVQTAMNLYIIFWGFAFGFTNLFSGPALWLALVALPLAVRSYLARAAIKERIGTLQHFLSDYKDGLYGRKLLRRLIFRKMGEKIRETYSRYLKGRIPQLLTVTALSLFVVYYFGYFKLHNYAYAYTDEETHLYWIQSLVNGHAFPAGLYPHGVHFLVATLSTMFGLQVVLCWHVFSILSSLLVFFSLYLLLRRLFTSVIAAGLGLGIFCFLDLFDVSTYFRYQYSLPMEFGYVSLFIMVFAILYYLRDRQTISLVFFAGALIWTFEVHFYITIAAIFVILAGGVVYIVPMIKNKIFHKIIIAGLLSVVIMISPFVIGYLLGHDFERSISWGLAIMSRASDEEMSETLTSNQMDLETTLNILNPGDSEDDEAEEEKTEDELFEEELRNMAFDKREQYEEYMALYVRDVFSLDDDEFQTMKNSLGSFVVNDVYAEEYVLHHMSGIAKITNVLMLSMLHKITGSLSVAVLLWVMELAALVYGFGGLLFALIKKKNPNRFMRLAFASLMWLFLYFAYLMPLIGLPEVFQIVRASELLSLSTSVLLCFPFQMVFDAISCIRPVRKYAEAVLMAAVVCLVFFRLEDVKNNTKKLENLFYDIAVQNEDLKLCNDLLENSEDFTWTVISPVNDLSVLRYQGYHYEIIDLLEEIEEGETEIYIPTKYIYLVVEEDIINFGTNKGDERKVDGSDYDETSLEISPELALKTLDELGRQNWSSRDRAYYDSRQGVMSKFYYWVEKIKETYPSEITLYDEDEHCKIYRIEQDPYFLLNLAVDYESEITQ